MKYVRKDGGFMDSELTHRKQLKKELLLLVLICLSMMLCSCDSRAGQYPYQVADEWACNVPCFILTYSNNQEYGKLKLEDETINVDVWFGLGDYWVLPKNSVAYDDRLLGGKWKYRKGDLVLSIEEDFLFEGKYSELVFSPVYSD